jgi:hypothetical protein
MAMFVAVNGSGAGRFSDLEEPTEPLKLDIAP